jgi:non-ribosomal peptide synthetase-like protein
LTLNYRLNITSNCLYNIIKMSIQETIVSNEHIIHRNKIIHSAESNDTLFSTYTFNESLSDFIKTQYADHKDLCSLFLTAFRILYSKYQFSNERLLCKNIISLQNQSGTGIDQISNMSFDFAPIQPSESSAQSVFNESKEAFISQYNLGDQLSEFNPFEIVLLALNNESEQIELECIIQVDLIISITFQSTRDSKFAEVVPNSAVHFTEILNAVQHSQDRPIVSFQILGTDEINTLTDWSMGGFDPVICRPDCLHHLFEETTTVFPDKTAIFCDGRTILYRELEVKANQLARHLQRKGIGKGDYCGILLSRSEAMYIAMLAILKAGAAYIPFDGSIPKDRLHFILDDSGCKGLISHSKFADKYHDCSCIKIIPEQELSEISLFEITPPDDLINKATPENVAYVIYTSGTTGTPKGVKISHAAICNLVKAENKIFRISPEDKVFQGFSISFDASLEEIWLAFNSGAELIVGTEDIVQSGNQIADFINENKITVFSTVPTLLASITEELPPVKTLILGGEACTTALVKKWAVGTRRMVNTYGPTEATVVATYSDCNPDMMVTIGKPIVNYCTYILDANQQIVPIGAAGELCIGGFSLAEGYINNPHLTASKFITPEFTTNPNFPNRLYRSGDLVRYNRFGEIEFLGRIDSQVKLRGFRIELAEIESQLLKNDNVKNCALTLRKDPGGLDHLVAYVTIFEGKSFDPAMARKELRANLAPYMVPSRFEVISEMPLLPSGKIDRKRLPEPKFDKELPITNYELRDSTQTHIMQLWESIFGIDFITPDDNFFELGGHSLLASQMISELRTDNRYEKLSVKDVYRYPTIAKLADFIDHPIINEHKSVHHKTRTAKKTSRLTYSTVTVLQFLSTLLIYGLTASFLLIPVLLENKITNITYTGIILGTLAGFVLFYFFWMILSIAVKWLVIGKFKEGSYPLWGFYFFRFWFVKKFIDIAPINLMTGTPFINLYFKLLGAKIGKNSYLATDRLRIFDLISIGDDCSLLKESTLLGYSIENEMLHLGKIFVGNRCFIGARAMMAKNTTMQDDSMLLELSLLSDHDTITQGAIWRGSPARPFKTEHNYLQKAGKRINGIKKLGFQSIQAVAFLFILLFPQLLAAPFAYILYEVITLYSLEITLLLCIPIVALFILLFCFSISVFKWLLLGKQKPMDFELDSLLYIRRWIVDSMIFMSLFYFRSIYATLYLPIWLRTTGAKVGKKAEISTLNHLSADLLDIGNQSFLADSTSIGVPMIYLGTIYLRETQIGDRSFIGNSAVLLPGSKIGNDCLIGVLSTAPETNGEKINGSSWLGSPPIYLPKRQESPEFPEKLTFNPPWYLYIARGTIEFFKITLPYAIASWIVIFFYQIIVPFSKIGNFTLLILLATLIFTTLSYSSMLFGLLSKWLLIGRYKQDAKPLWSTFVWRNEFINSINECLIFPLYQNMMLGTPMAPFFFRMMGSKIGRKVYMETNEITEFDLVQISTGSCLNFGCTIQTHLFEDRVMKMSKIDIGKRCTIGAMSVVLYDSKMGNHSILDGLSLLMKGETLPARTKWQGSPSCRINR